MPLDEYSGLRWMPNGKELAFLHRPLEQDPPSKTELWTVNGAGSPFSRAGDLSSEFQWTLTKNSTGPWLLLEGVAEGRESQWILADSSGKVKELAVPSPWVRLRSQGDGLYYQMREEALPFDQFVDVEEAPDMKPELGEPVESEYRPEEVETELSKPPTHPGIKIASFNPDTDTLDPLFSIPYSRPEDKPTVTLVRRSPDQRFLALIVQFGDVGSPGLWVYDSQNQRLLWTRVVVEDRAIGIDWSSDSVRVAVSDVKGLSLLENALGIESKRLELASADGLFPMWGAGRKLYLVNDKVVYRMEKERSVAQPVFDSQNQDRADDLALDALGERVAFSVSPSGYRELVVTELSTNQTLARVAYPGSLRQKSQKTLAYQMGSAIRYAWIRWTGRG
jgi:hypothetical protein